MGLLVMGLAATGVAQDLTGKWIGTYKVNAKNMSAQERTEFEAIAKSTKLVMTIKKDKTYVVEISGETQKSKTEGSFRIEKGKLIMTDHRRNGKAVPDNQRRSATFNILNGGKELQTTVGATRVPAILSFKRG
jgi:hypothetical protein